jgi:hypothetical protein
VIDVRREPEGFFSPPPLPLLSPPHLFPPISASIFNGSPTHPRLQDHLRSLVAGARRPGAQLHGDDRSGSGLVFGRTKAQAEEENSGHGHKCKRTAVDSRRVTAVIFSAVWSTIMLLHGSCSCVYILPVVLCTVEYMGLVLECAPGISRTRMYSPYRHANHTFKF